MALVFSIGGVEVRTIAESREEALSLLWDAAKEEGLLRDADQRVRTLELALREARRFAHSVTQWTTPNGEQWREAADARALADKALGYCGCPTCSAVQDAHAP